MSKQQITLGDFSKPKNSYIAGAEEYYGNQRANSRTHKSFLRKHKLGKFKKGLAK